MTDRALFQQALDALESATGYIHDQTSTGKEIAVAITALRERLAQPEFPTHEESDDGWSDWVCPDPKSYLMKCCDCGLVHEAQFGVVRYASQTERENCEKVDDPNLQAVFRMRRSEQWTPKDTAYRPGGLAQPEHDWEAAYTKQVELHNQTLDELRDALAQPDTTPPRREWVGLTIEDKKEYLAQDFGGSRADAMDWAEKRLKEKNT